jgi:phosphatidylserine/phosphatidylglycerophosphate/cardiolipin synthase-like enzyme
MKKTAKKKIDEIIGITIIVIIAIFVGRYFLSDVEAYKKIENQISQKLNIPEITEKVVKTLSFDDGRDHEEYQRKREARIEAGKRPDFGIEVPFKKKVESEYEVIPLMDKEYYPALRSAIKKAKKSIYVAMFVVSMGKSTNDPVNILLNELIAAKKRGVDVKVVVENPPSSGSSLYKTNEKVVTFLREEGIEASFDEPDKEVHDKFILIDEDTLFVGNHNWSKQSLTINRELSVMVKACPPDPEFLKHFARIKLAKPEETKEGKIKLIKELYKELLSRDKQKMQ